MVGGWDKLACADISSANAENRARFTPPILTRSDILRSLRGTLEEMECYKRVPHTLAFGSFTAFSHEGLV